jgi:hypothetical protein
MLGALDGAAFSAAIDNAGKNKNKAGNIYLR